MSSAKLPSGSPNSLDAARQAVDHERWFRAEVQRTLDGIMEGTIETISQAEPRLAGKGRGPRF
jgi:hypothetical protein